MQPLPARSCTLIHPLPCAGGLCKPVLVVRALLCYFYTWAIIWFLFWPIAMLLPFELMFDRYRCARGGGAGAERVATSTFLCQRHGP